MPNTKEQFLDEDYQEPVTSRYMKFEEGVNRFRVLPAKAGKQTLIMGWEYWVTVDGKRKPIRVSKDTQVPISKLETDPKTGELDMPKFFWALAVWNYAAKTVQILELKQKTVRQALTGLSKNPKWGSPTGYDLVVTQTVENSKVSYTVTPDPKEDADPAILEAYNSTPVDLEALFKSGDPFATSDASVEDLGDEELERVNKEMNA